MKPGEYIIRNEKLELNSNNSLLHIEVINEGDRPIQVEVTIILLK